MTSFNSKSLRKEEEPSPAVEGGRRYMKYRQTLEAKSISSKDEESSKEDSAASLGGAAGEVLGDDFSNMSENEDYSTGMTTASGFSTMSPGSALTGPQPAMDYSEASSIEDSQAGSSLTGSLATVGSQDVIKRRIAQLKKELGEDFGEQVMHGSSKSLNNEDSYRSTGDSYRSNQDTLTSYKEEDNSTNEDTLPSVTPVSPNTPESNAGWETGSTSSKEGGDDDEDSLSFGEAHYGQEEEASSVEPGSVLDDSATENQMTAVPFGSADQESSSEESESGDEDDDDYEDEPSETPEQRRQQKTPPRPQSKRYLCLIAFIAIILGGIFAIVFLWDNDNAEPRSPPTFAPVDEVPTFAPIPSTPRPTAPRPRPTPRPTNPVVSTPSPTLSQVTPFPTSPEARTATQILTEASFDNGAALNQAGSPQRQALQWILTTNTEGLSREKLIQRYALATFFMSTGGQDEWEESTGWMTDTDECSWYSRTGNGICNNDGVVDALEFSFHGLVGSIPAEIGLLTGLQSISLSNNRLFTGPLPTTLGLLTNVETFSMRGSFLNGVVPTELGKLEKLHLLDLSTNRLNGRVPDELQACTDLKSLFLAGNRLNGRIPSQFSTLSNLEILTLDRNQLTGPIPFGITILPNLNTLRLSNNQLDGSLATITNLASAVEIAVDFNLFSGSLPAAMSSLSRLVRFNARSNLLEGNIPSELGQINTLEELDLSENLFQGTIPASLGLLRQLKTLRLQNNELVDGVPSSFGLLRSLRDLRLEQNDLTEDVPEQVCALFVQTTPTFATDCLAVGDVRELECSCCTICCHDILGCL